MGDQSSTFSDTLKSLYGNDATKSAAIDSLYDGSNLSAINGDQAAKGGTFENTLTQMQTLMAKSQQDSTLSDALNDRLKAQAQAAQEADNRAAEQRASSDTALMVSIYGSSGARYLSLAGR